MEAEEREAGNEVVKLPVVFTSLTCNKLKESRGLSMFPPQSFYQKVWREIMELSSPEDHAMSIRNVCNRSLLSFPSEFGEMDEDQEHPTGGLTALTEVREVITIDPTQFVPLRSLLD